MDYTVTNITYVPETDTIQALIRFPYNGKNGFAVMSYKTATYPALTTDVKALQTTDTFITLVNGAIATEKNIIDNPIM
jgi:hypothetical protein